MMTLKERVEDQLVREGSTKRLTRQVWRQVFKSYDLDVGCTFPKLIAQLNKMVEGVPPDQIDNVTVEWADGGDDSGYLEFELYRRETDEEMNARVSTRRRELSDVFRQKEQHERAQLAALKAVYEP